MSLATPILLVIAAWWLGTGLVLYLQQRIENVRAPLIISLSGIALLSLVTMIVAASGMAPWNSYLGFMSAVCLWGCIELSYYTGLVAGVHKRTCPEQCNTVRRFRLALGASIWHEVSALFIGGILIILLMKSENPAGLYSFIVLWLMRWSAKLNLFFGVPNFNTDWFPKRLAYAHSYIRRAPVSLFFPVSVLCASLVAAHMFHNALARPPAEALPLLLPGTLLMLAILEHLFMALPIADSELWNRIFAREADDMTTAHDQHANDENTLFCTQERSQNRVNTSMTPSTNRPLSVKLKAVEATATHSVGR